MSAFVSVAADLLVAVLLVASIVTSARLSRRMAKLKSDESTMRATIGELLVATDSAERAIAGLRATVAESERALSDRLGAAQRHAQRLADHVQAGESVIARVGQIADVSRRMAAAGGEGARTAVSAAEPPGAGEGLRATILAARDVAARASLRIDGRAA